MKSDFWKSCIDALKEVETWPKWKQDALGETTLTRGDRNSVEVLTNDPRNYGKFHLLGRIYTHRRAFSLVYR